MQNTGMKLGYLESKVFKRRCQLIRLADEMIQSYCVTFFSELIFFGHKTRGKQSILLEKEKLNPLWAKIQKYNTIARINPLSASN